MLPAGYEYLATLGRGARSTVYRVRKSSPPGRPESDPGPDFALKILDWSISDPDASLAAFRREAALLAGVSHPGLATIHEVGEVGPQPYLVRDLIDGRSLAEVLTAGPMTPGQVIALGLDLVDPLGAVHRRGLIHRDLKPANIMILPTGAARLIDFGLTARDGDQDPATTAGTLAYSAPEQSGLLRRPVDARSDLYALGAVLFECLTGVMPFRSPEVGELLRMHATVPAPAVADLAPGTPAGLADVIALLLAKDPDDRYQNDLELGADLRALAQDPSMRPGTARGLRRSGRRMGDPGRRLRDLGHSTALGGRIRELSRLRARWHRAAGGQGGVCLIGGGSGIGKTRLAAELGSEAESTAGVVLWGRSSADDPLPFGPLRAALERYLSDLGRLPAQERERRNARIRAACPPGAAAVLGGLAPGLERVLRAVPGPAAAELLDGPDSQGRFAVTVAGFLTGLARESGPDGGLMLLLDDVQWLDPGSRRVLAELADDLPDLPLLVVAAGRNDPGNSSGTDAFVTAMGPAVDLVLGLQPLGEEEMSAQIEALLPGLASVPGLSAVLRRLSNGNPFLLEEYVRAIVDAGLLRPSWGTWLLDEPGLTALELPPDAIGLVIRRLDGIGPRSRDLLTLAAAIGSRFRAPALAAVAELDLEAVHDVLSRAADLRLLDELANGEFRFGHDRIRGALLADHDCGQVDELHGRIAEAMQAMPAPEGGHPAGHSYAVAHNYVQGQKYLRSHPQAQARAFAACWAAGRLALDNHAPEEAVRFLKAVAGLGIPLDGEFLLLLGAALKQTGRLVEARERLKQALALETDPPRRAEILTLIADVHRSHMDVEAALTAVDQGLAELGARMPRHRLTIAVSTMLMFAAALLMRWTGVGFGTATGTDRQRCRLISGLHEVGAHAAALGLNSSLVMAHTLRPLYWTTRLGGGRHYCLAQASYGLICSVLGRKSAAEAAFTRAESDPVNAHPAVGAKTIGCRATAAYLTGQDNGQQLSASALGNARWLDLSGFLEGVLALIFECCAQGRTAEAEDWLNLGRRRLGDRAGLMPFTCAGALIPAIQGRPGPAETALAETIAHFASGAGRGLALARLTSTLVVLVEQADFGPRFDAAVAEFEALKLSPGQLIRVYRIIDFYIALGRLAQLRGADPGRRPARLIAARQAVRQLARTGRIDVLQARSLIAQADLLVLEDHPQLALDRLEQVKSFYRPVAPRLSYLTAVVRARALTALGELEEARHQARSALGIAEEEVWPHRIRELGAEFGIAPAERNIFSGSEIRSTGRPSAVDRQRQRRQALQEVSSAASRVLDPAALARITLDEALRVLGGQRAFLFLCEPETGSLILALGRGADGHDEPELTGYSKSLVDRVHRSGEALVMTGTDEGATLRAQSVVRHGLRSVLVAPLQLKGRMLGIVYLDSRVAEGIFTADDVGILIALTDHIASSLESARAARLEISVQTARRQRDLADTLRRTLQSMSETLDPAEVLKRLLGVAVEMVACDTAWILGSAGSRFSLLTAEGPGGALKTYSLLTDPALDELLARSEPLVGSVTAVPGALAARMLDTASWIALPLPRIDEGRAGVLILATSRPGAQLVEEIEIAALLAAQGSAVYNQALLFEKVQRLSVTDELTGVANRRQFFETAARDLSSARRHGRVLTALMIDIDHFKQVNDLHGHATGDDVIRTVAGRLGTEIRQSDLLARYGGEEFVVLLLDPAPANDVPERLRRCIADQPIATGSGPVQISISIGQAFLTGSDADIEQLLARADQALYQAKSQGRNRVAGSP